MVRCAANGSRGDGRKGIGATVLGRAAGLPEPDGGRGGSESSGFWYVRMSKRMDWRPASGDDSAMAPVRMVVVSGSAFMRLPIGIVRLAARGRSVG